MSGPGVTESRKTESMKRERLLMSNMKAPDFRACYRVEVIELITQEGACVILHEPAFYTYRSTTQQGLPASIRRSVGCSSCLLACKPSWPNAYSCSKWVQLNECPLLAGRIR